MLQEVEGQRRVLRNRWRKLLGELRIIMLAIPGAEGMFSHIQAALVKSGSSNRIKVDCSTRDKLRDWKGLAGVNRNLAHLDRATDADKAGMRGVIFDLTKQAEPIVWRQPFPVKIQSRWVSDVNPRGEIINSDAELCGVIGAQHL